MVDNAADASSSTERAEALVGQVIAERYKIHNVLAMGGMGAVYTGEHVHMRKRVAIKVLHPDTEGLPGLVARFEREAIVGAHIEHKNIAAARDFGRMKDGSYYLVLEFVKGMTLRQLLRQGQLSLARALRIARQMAIGLAKLHGKHIVHRDLNPRNVMVVGAKDTVKLIDFGFAKVPVEKFKAMSFQKGQPTAPSQITGDGIIFGTIGFLAPEAAFGMRSVDSRSDLYALGAIFYEMLCGEPPFEGDTQAALFLKHRMDPVPAMSARAPGVKVDPAHEAIARKLLAKEPAQRYRRADEVVKALEDALEGLDPESDGIVVEHEEPASIQMTIAGAEQPTSLPRFEDVAVEVDTSELDLRRPERRPERRRNSATAPEDVSVEPIVAGPMSSSRAVATTPEKRSSLGLYIGLAVLVAAGAGAAIYFVKGGFGGPTPTPSSAPSEKLARTTPLTPASQLEPSNPGLPTPPPSASPSALVGGQTAEQWARVVRQAPTSKDFGRAIDAVLALAELDAGALATPEMRVAAVEVAANSDAERVPKLVDAYATRFGADGVDVLHEIVTMRGGSLAATRGAEALKKPDVRARGTAAFRIALELREAPCGDRIALLERAKTEGDARALGILAAMYDADCSSNMGSCCMPQNAQVGAAISELGKRLKQK